MVVKTTVSQIIYKTFARASPVVTELLSVYIKTNTILSNGLASLYMNQEHWTNSGWIKQNNEGFNDASCLYKTFTCS